MHARRHAHAYINFIVKSVGCELAPALIYMHLIQKWPHSCSRCKTKSNCTRKRHNMKITRSKSCVYMSLCTLSSALCIMRHTVHYVSIMRFLIASNSPAAIWKSESLLRPAYSRRNSRLLTARLHDAVSGQTEINGISHVRDVLYIEAQLRHMVRGILVAFVQGRFSLWML